MEIIEFDSVSSLTNNDLEAILAPGFGGDHGVSSEAFIAYRRQSLKASLAQKNKTTGFIAQADGRCLGFIVIAVSNWDSDILGLPVGKVLWFNTLPAGEPEAGTRLLNSALGKAREWNVECLMTRIDYNQNHLIRLLEDNGFRLMDVSVALGLASENIPPDLPKPEGKLIRLATTGDLSILKEIARSSFRYSHFHMDPELSQERSNELFACWIENDVNGRADQVLLIEDHGQVAGFVTLNIDPDSEESLGFKVGEIDLIAVSSEHQGKGLGQFLVRAGLDWLRPKVQYVEARTQLMNHSALNTFTKNQFQLLNTGIFLPSGATLHGWLSRN
jgi:GNAT superfamily N-acetyltransferase